MIADVLVKNTSKSYFRQADDETHNIFQGIRH